MNIPVFLDESVLPKIFPAGSGAPVLKQQLYIKLTSFTARTTDGIARLVAVSVPVIAHYRQNTGTRVTVTY